MKSSLKSPKLLFCMLALLVYGKTIGQVKLTDITNEDGYVSVQYFDSPEGESFENITDNKAETKYLTFNRSAWMQFQQAKPSVVTKYTLTSADDIPDRDPISWILVGSNDGQTWATLDKRTNENFADRLLKREFSFTNKAAYTYYRLTMEARKGTILQLAEWEIFGTGGGGMPPLPKDITDLGGLVSAEIDNSPVKEEIAMVIDNDIKTKFLTTSSSCWIQLQQATGSIATKYTITSANDLPQRDPHHWTLQGSNDGETWLTLDTRSNEMFPTRFATRAFSITNNNTSYSYYRLNLSTNGSRLLQLAEWEIFGFGGGGNPPPIMLTENHFNHNQPLRRVYNVQHLDIYYDKDLHDSVTWTSAYLKKAWQYVNNVYGDFGTKTKLVAYFHGNKYTDSGHTLSYLETGGNGNNIIDVGTESSKDTQFNLDLVTIQLANLVADAAKGYQHSSAQELWKDKWTQIFAYDIYKGLGMAEEAEKTYNRLINTQSNFPRNNTYWFRDWFYPIHKNYGNSVALDKFFALTAQYFPKNGTTYARKMNWGEFVHFWSGAAGVNLKDLATKAFGWPAEWEQQFTNAQREFPFVYTPVRIIEKPLYSSRGNNSLDLTKIELRDSTAVFHLEYSYSSSWVSFDPIDNIVLPNGKEIKSNYIYGIKTYTELWTTKPVKYHFSVVFQGIDSSVAFVDYNPSGWGFIDIQLKEDEFKSPLPQYLLGNWLMTDGSNQFVFGLHDKKAIYQNQVWDYDRVEQNGKTTVIHLKNGAQSKSVYAQAGKKGKYKLGETLSKLTEYSKTRTENTKYKAEQDEAFGKSVFKHDTATYKGYVKGYRPRTGQTTGSIFVGNIITGKQESYLVQINDDGSFEVKFPMNYPQEIFVRFPYMNTSVYLEPGSKVFHLLDKNELSKNTDSHSVFMGDCARINQELTAFKKIMSTDYNQLMTDIVNLSPEEYKKYMLRRIDQKIDHLTEYQKTHFVSKKGAWYIETGLKYAGFEAIMDYSNLAEYASSAAKKDDKNLVKPIAKPDPAYYAFLKEIPLNDERNVILNMYSSLLNRIQFSDVLRPSAKSMPAYSTVLNELENSGTVFSKEEKQVIDTLKQIEVLATMNLKKEIEKII
jgi:hypothetical protein